MTAQGGVGRVGTSTDEGASSSTCARAGQTPSVLGGDGSAERGARFTNWFDRTMTVPVETRHPRIDPSRGDCRSEISDIRPGRCS